MSNDVIIATHRHDKFDEFLELHDFVVEKVGEFIYKITREEELPVFINIDGNNMFFEVDLGNVSAFADKDFCFKLLDLNTKILPVSFGIDSTNPDDIRLVLVESRVTGNLNDEELLSVFDSLELAVDRAEELLAEYIG
ncbi:MAG: hypothetical protein IME97_00100 [Proteobacteria bacterium]|jgi:uncharacterized protein YjfI (DUF2170 family)|nr:hypothetical protein [Pseudomonadota bacterium]